MMRRIALLLAALALGGPVVAAGSDSPTADLLTQLLRFDTSNAPGRTIEQARFLDGLFRAAGAETVQVATPADGKVHFFARLKGDGSKRPVLLAAHSDVVPVERKSWSVDPFAGVVRDGYVLGRGAMDFKGGQAVFARAVLMLAENHVKLARDVIFLAEADEEYGEFNTVWLAKEHWSLMECEFALNEGGWIFQDAQGRTRQVNITTRDKVGVSLRLSTTGTSTHASRPMPESAITHLVTALAKLAAWDPDPTLNDQSRAYFAALAESAPPALAAPLRQLAESRDPAVLREAGRAVVARGDYPLLWHALMRNTIAETMVNAGIKENVIPGSADAIVNLRLIPGSTPWDVIAEMRAVIADPSVAITLASGMTEAQARPLFEARTNAPPSSTDTDLYRALVASSRRLWPEARVVPALFEAGTDATAWRQRGVPVYGIYPYPLDNDTLERMHGNDERIAVKSLEEGTQLIYDTLLAVAGR